MNATLNGRYRFEIHRPDGSVSHPFGGDWTDNVITNAGLDAMFTKSQAVGDTTVVNGSGYGFLVPMAWCKLSTSGTQSTDPTVPTLNQQGAVSSRYVKAYPAIPENSATVTTTTADFVVPAAGASVQISVVTTVGLWDGAAVPPVYPLFIAGAGYFTVVSVQSGTLVTIINSGATVPEATNVTSGATITLYYPNTVNQVTYGSDATWAWAVFQRTFVFTPTGVDRNWNGVATSWNSIASDPVLSRIATPATLTVGGFEELRVIFQLTVKLPKVAAAVILTSGTFDATGDVKAIGAYSSIFGGIDSNGVQTGATTANTLPHIMRGNGTPTGYLLTNSVFPADGGGITPSYSGVSQADSTATTSTPAAYTDGDFYRDFPLVWVANRPAATESDIRSFFLSTSASPSGGIQWLMGANQTKAPDKSLSATFRIAWARP